MAADYFDTDLAPHILGKEGGYTNDPQDSGETNWGITVGTARRYGYVGQMQVMLRSQAVAIYRARYWMEPKFNLIQDLSRDIAHELFDSGVNLGPAVPTIWLQEDLNALNNGGTDYPDLKEDGDLGPTTQAALRAYLKRRGKEGERVLLACLNADQAVRYKALARGRPKDERFFYGWIAQRVLTPA